MAKNKKHQHHSIFNQRLNKIIATLLYILILTPALSTSLAANSAVIVVYHRFGDNRHPLTNITIEQFDAHIALLSSETYNVLPIDEILLRQRSGKKLPDRTVGITIDDAFSSVYHEAWPRLRDAELPFTLFVSTDPIDRGYKDMMSWEQIREMAQAGVIIGAHTGSHLHMNAHSSKYVNNELTRSNVRFQNELGKIPTLFAYPYGESSLANEKIVKRAGYKAAFGQHSGAFTSQDNQFNLPRFPMNEKYGDMGRFKTAINALAIPIKDLTPRDTLLNEENPPVMGFTLSEPMQQSDQMSCFLSHEGKAEIKNLNNVRFEVRVTTPFPTGRTRLNCTVPGWGENSGRWHWFGRQFYLNEVE